MLRDYSVIGDISVIVLCLVIYLLKHSTYINRTKRFRLVELALILLSVSAFSNLLYYSFVPFVGRISDIWFYLFKFFYHIPLLAIFVVFINYLDRLLQIDKQLRKENLFWCCFFLGIFAILTILAPITKFGFHINNGVLVERYFLNPFSVGYVFYIGCIIYGMRKYRGFFMDRVYNCIFQTSSISVLIVLFQASIRNSSFIVMTFFFPVFIMFYLFHSSPYDFSIGALNYESFNYYIEELNKIGKKYGLLFVKFNDSRITSRIDLRTKKTLYSIYHTYFNRPYTFRIEDDIFCVVYDKNDYQSDRFEALMNDFLKLYEYIKLDFKFILMEDTSYSEDVKEILEFYRFIADKMEDNEFYLCKQQDYEKFNKQSYILSELKDIVSKGDLNDERVLVYCQPIYDVENKTFVTAEALMRLKLDKIGLVFPDMFIELAEKNDYIHGLTKIILNKTCKMIEELERENYRIDRISINFSMKEFRMEGFCDAILSIINQYDIDCSRIAIELTESEKNRNEYVKDKMMLLREAGLKFYLDDYGSGYSNLERIMELPLDVIKFDRSLLLLSAKDQNYKYMVDNFANVFSKMDYKVLFEGVETEDDELNCIKMKANYLQGYKYSKPIPIEKLKDFLSQN